MEGLDIIEWLLMLYHLSPTQKKPPDFQKGAFIISLIRKHRVYQGTKRILPADNIIPARINLTRQRNIIIPT